MTHVYVYSELHCYINQKMLQAVKVTSQSSGARASVQHGQNQKRWILFPLRRAAAVLNVHLNTPAAAAHTRTGRVYLVFLSCCVGSLLSCGIPDLLRLFLQTAAAAAAATEAPPVTETRAGRSRGSCTVTSSRAEFEQRRCGRTCIRDAAPLRWTPKRHQALRWCETRV